MEEKLFFTVKTGIKSIVGKDLITDDYIAIFELVKNSYDAHAKNVTINFEENKIIIADDGKGMSKDELQTKWLALAYSAKKDGTEDDERNSSYRDEIQKKRFYAGAKGIGRFSCDRLGKELVIYTKRKSDKKINQLNISWLSFENDDKEDFIKIPVLYNEIEFNLNTFPNNSLNGTILEIKKTSFWDREKIKNLKHSLEKLINPFSEKNDFQIKIICEREKYEDDNGKYKLGPNKGNRYTERDKINGFVKNAILDILKIKTSHIKVLISKGFIETKIVDRGTLIYHTKEPSIFNKIKSSEIDLYFLNRSAKINFKKMMGIDAVNFGSIFLFKNGFRVQPFGETGNDSWGIDFRSQQGYNRFLGTRDLFGRVEITTNDFEEFKEVTSRDGGLVETEGYFELISAFELAHRRLERYVVGVLWGEGFKRKKYFGEGNHGNKIAEDFRKELSDDKDSDNLEIAKTNLGSKLDFIQIIKNLSSNKNIQILDYNRDFVNLINEKIDENQKKFIDDLELIADQTNDLELKTKVLKIEQQFLKLKKEKEEAEKKSEDDERRRIEAEEKTQREEKKRKEAEANALEEAEKRRKAEVETLKKEKERAEAELAKFKAQKKAKEEEEARKKAQKETENITGQLDEEKKKSAFKGALIGIDKEKIIGLQHQVAHSSGRINRNIKLLLKHLGNNLDLKSRKFISIVSLEANKVNSIANFITKANFNLTAEEIKTDLVHFIIDYINEIYLAEDNIIDINIKVKIIKNIDDFELKIVPLDITTLIDNFIINSEKANSKNMTFEFSEQKSNLIIRIKDDGKGITSDRLSKIFELGYTTTAGSGIGLFQNLEIVKSLKGSIEVFSEQNKDTTFLITIPK